MIESTRPKLNRFKYAAMLAGAMAVAAFPLAYPAIAQPPNKNGTSNYTTGAWTKALKTKWITASPSNWRPTGSAAKKPAVFS